MKITSFAELQQRADRARESAAALAAKALQPSSPSAIGDGVHATPDSDGAAVHALQAADDDGWPTHASRNSH